MGIVALGYIGLEVGDLGAWSRFSEDVLGLMRAGEAGHRYRIDSQAWRISLQQGDGDDLSYAGFEVADAAAHQALRERLAQAGFVPSSGDAQLIAERG